MERNFIMKYRLLSFALLLSMLAGFAACGKNEETANDPPPAGAYESAAAVSNPEPVKNIGEEPPALSEADYIASAEEILLAVSGENAPNAETADIAKVKAVLSERPEIELTYSIGDGKVVIIFDKETGRLRELDGGLDGLLKPAQYAGPESAARAWYAALPFPQDYTLRSVVPYGDDLLSYEFNRLVTLETGGEPVELFSSCEAVRIMIYRDTGALVMANAFHWPVFDGYSQKTAISEAEAVEIARQSRSISGEDALNAQIVLHHAYPYDPVSISICSPEQSVNYSFPAWKVTFRWKNDEFDSATAVYVDLYTGEILRKDYM